MKIPKECYEEYGKDLDGCSTQELEGCGRCILANPKVVSRAKWTPIEARGKFLGLEGPWPSAAIKTEDFTTATRETIVYKLSGYDVEVALEEMRIDYTEEQLHDIIDYIDEHSLDIPWTEYMIPTIEMAIEEGVMGNIPYNPEEGDKYYYPSFDICTMWLNGIWDDTKRDENTKKAVGVYRTKEEAIAKAKELWGLEEELK